MKKHEVTVALPMMPIGQRGITLEINTKEAKVGNITILKDGIEYYGNSWEKVVKLSWTQLDKMIKDWAF
jgi:hypothetical protein